MKQQLHQQQSECADTAVLCLQRHREADLDSKGRCKGTLGSDCSLLPTGIQGQDRTGTGQGQWGAPTPHRVTQQSPPDLWSGTLGTQSKQGLTWAPSPRADGTRGAQAATASGTSYAKESHGFGEITQFSTALLRVQQGPLPKQHRPH